jgi:radial spoke head protein 3
MSKYTFTEGPRTVAAKRAKYRDEDGPKPSMGNSMNNLMFDRRVVRGNTFHSLGAGISPMNVAQKQKPRKRRKEPVSIFDLRPKLNRNEPVNLEAYLVEKTNDVPEVNETTQTDVFAEKDDKDDVYVPKKTGIDAYTQIEDADNLFKFDEEVEPILEILVGKTMEQALQEVEEEDELKNLRERKRVLYEQKEAEEQRIKGMEEDEIKLYQSKEDRVNAEKDRVERERLVSQKVGASTLSQGMVGEHLVNSVFDRMQEAGHFKDATRLDVENKFMPWIMDMVGGELNNIENSRALVDEAIKKALHTQKQNEDQQKLKDEASEQMALIGERRRDGPSLQGLIRIKVDGIDGLDQIGPVMVGPNDTIAQVELKIQQWIRDNMGQDVMIPDGGFLNAGVNYQGKPLEQDKTLLDANVTDNAILSVGSVAVME